jgi:hypothetical protein
METQEIKLDTILSSKVYIHEKSQASFGSPNAFIEPFLEKFKDINPTYRVAVSERSANKDSVSGALNEAYGRVLVEAKFPAEFTAYSHDSVIGMVYSLDTQKPIIKLYSGQNAWACTNLAIFGARYVNQVEILHGYSSIYEKALEYIEGMTNQIRKFKELHEKMNEKQYEGEEINTIIGHLLRESYKNKAIGTNPVLSALKDLEDNKSRYAIRDGKTSQWNVYSAMTQYVTDKSDISDKATKTVSISNLFVPDILN